MWHFDLKKFRPNEVRRVKISLACVFAFMAIGWPLIIYKTGIMGWIKYWFMPWLGYHFWVRSSLSYYNYIGNSIIPNSLIYLTFMGFLTTLHLSFQQFFTMYFTRDLLLSHNKIYLLVLGCVDEYFHNGPSYGSSYTF